MATRYITSSFSLQMMPTGGRIKVTPDADWSLFWLQKPAPIVRIGHEGTARWLETKVNRFLASDTHTSYRGGEYKTVRVKHPTVNIQVDRAPVSLEVGDSLLVLQPIGNRLAPGQELSDPEISVFLATVEDANLKLVTQEFVERNQEV